MFSRLHRSAGAFVAGILLLAVACGTATAGEADMENYRLTEDGLDNFEQATESLYAFMAAHPEYRQALRESEGGDDDEDFAAIAQRFEAGAPGISEVMEDAGMPLEEYFRFTMVFALNAFSVAMIDQYGGKQEDADLTDTARSNIAFVRTNMQRFTDLDARMKKQYGPIMDE